MKNYGLILPEKIETREEGAAHVFGASGIEGRVVNALGDWTTFLSLKEPQSKYGVETNGCSYYGSENALESLEYLLTGVQPNYSERYPINVGYRKGKIDPYRGANPHDTLEILRNESGLLEEGRAPWTGDIDTVEKYYSLDTAPLLPVGKRYYKSWVIRHEWVFLGGTPQEKRAKLKEALTKGAVCVSVHAWKQNDKGVFYKPRGSRDNHWCQLVSAHDGEPYKIFDSYDTYVKPLDPLYDFSVAKIFYLTRTPFLFTKNLYYGLIDPTVADLQKALISLNYAIPHAVTTVYGGETRDAVALFQKHNGISDNGTHFGPQTRLALNKALRPNLNVLDALIVTLRTYAGI